MKGRRGGELVFVGLPGPRLDAATAALLARKGSRFMRHSGIQYLELR